MNALAKAPIEERAASLQAIRNDPSVEQDAAENAAAMLGDTN
jgi:hypothetical protein